MALWTDVIEPAELTGYARESLEAREKAKGSLARFLPHREVMDTVARFFVGDNGLVSEATFRAYDAEIEIGKGDGGRRVTIDLPAIGKNVPVSEYSQLRARNASDEAIRKVILRATDNVVAAVSDRIERLRGTILATGKATTGQTNFALEADFGRDSTLTVAAATLWSASGAKPLDDLTAWCDKYAEINGVMPGRIVMGSKALRALLASESMRTVLVGGASRPASLADAQTVLDGQGLPEIERFTRRTSGGLVVPENTILLLPEPVDPLSGVSELGATFWGQTLTASAGEYGIAEDEQPGIVAGVYRGEKPPMIAEVISDAIALPVLANANLSMAAKVL